MEPSNDHRNIFFIKDKSEVHNKFLQVVQKCEQVKYKIQALFTDNGVEFYKIKMTNVLGKLGM